MQKTPKLTVSSSPELMRRNLRLNRSAMLSPPALLSAVVTGAAHITQSQLLKIYKYVNNIYHIKFNLSSNKKFNGRGLSVQKRDKTKK